MSLATINWTPDDIENIKNMYCKNCNDEEFKLFSHVCTSTGLDPRRNQIYAIKRKERMTIQTGIDGFRLIAERTGKYAPGREPTYNYDAQGKLVSATAYVKKLVAGTWHEVSATAFWNEYVVAYNGKPSDFWNKMPHNQLAKCAESLCLRKAFPADYSGLNTTEEMGQADNGSEINITPQMSIEVPQIEMERKEIPLAEVQEWIQKNYSQEPDSFLIWIDEVRKKQDWSYEKCIKQFTIQPKKTLETFQSWLMNRVGL